MSIATEISRLQTAKSDIKSAIELKGVTVPSSAKLDTYDDYIADIQTGASGVSLSIYTQPSPTEYNLNEPFALQVFQALETYNDGTQRIVPLNQMTFVPAIGSTLSTEGTRTVTASADGLSVTFQITVVGTKVYGVSWAGTSATTMSRTDASASFTNPNPAVNNGSGSSPFDNLYPWSGMVRVTDSSAGELVAIPKYWYKWTKSGSTLQLQIADGAVDGFYVSPAHADRGDGKGERDVVYVGRYHCSSSNYKSATGVKPKVSITRSTARTSIHNLGTNIWQWDIAMLQTIQMLYIVEFADWNSQTKIGYGCGNNSAVENVGATDSMGYHTGTKQSSRTTYGVGTQYRYIEGLWDNCYDWLDGCYYNSSGLNIINNPNSFSDSSGGTSVGKPSSGYISAFNVGTAFNKQWIYASGNSGSGSTYCPDYWYFSASYPCLHVGGYYYQSLYYGLFYVSCASASSSSVEIGCRLQKLP